MAEHEPSTGQSDDWYTPPEIFAALRLQFDLDPCSPGRGAPYCWVPANHVYTKANDGLSQPWNGLVFVNPPFGGRFGHVPWLVKFFDHGNGVAIVRAYTSSSWWHDLMPRAELILFPRGKTKFIRGTDMIGPRGETYPAGSRGTAPGHGIVLVGMGDVARAALIQSKLGMAWELLVHGSRLPRDAYASSREGQMAPSKVVKQTAQYRDHPKGNQYCGKCSMFVRPSGCTVVIGKISPSGWCKYWEEKRDA